MEAQAAHAAMAGDWKDRKFYTGHAARTLTAQARIISIAGGEEQIQELENEKRVGEGKFRGKTRSASGISAACHPPSIPTPSPW